MYSGAFVIRGTPMQTVISGKLGLSVVHETA
jgi:hypothetical protein